MSSTSTAAGSVSSDDQTTTNKPLGKLNKRAAEAIAEQQQGQGQQRKKQRSSQQRGREHQNTTQAAEDGKQAEHDALGLPQQLLKLQRQMQQQLLKLQRQLPSSQQCGEEHQNQTHESEKEEEQVLDNLETVLQQLQQLRELQQQLQGQQLQQQQDTANATAKAAREVDHSQIRARLLEAVQKNAVQLLDKGDIILLVLLPYHNSASLRTFTQGLTREQLSAILEVLLRHPTGSLGWAEKRVQALLRKLGAGAAPGGGTQGTAQQQQRQYSQQQLYKVE